MHTLIEKIKAYADLSESEIELLTNSVEKKTFKKKKFFKKVK